MSLQRLHTFGFRGEALSSLAALGELSVITRTAEQVNKRPGFSHRINSGGSSSSSSESSMKKSRVWALGAVSVIAHSRAGEKD
jgi:DNA mismatch repair ATPase MutL